MVKRKEVWINKTYGKQFIFHAPQPILHRCFKDCDKHKDVMSSLIKPLQDFLTYWGTIINLSNLNITYTCITKTLQVMNQHSNHLTTRFFYDFFPKLPFIYSLWVPVNYSLYQKTAACLVLIVKNFWAKVQVEEPIIIDVYNLKEMNKITK